MLSFCLVLWTTTVAHAWENHQGIQERIFESPARLGIPQLNAKVKVPSAEDEKKEIQSLAKWIGIDGSKVPVLGKKTASEARVLDLLISNMIDEPDQGMDQNLGEEFDPAHDRAWMGGATGPTSQGFRHMIFKGVDFTSPLSTFQIPLRSVGQALERIEKLKGVSNDYFAKKNYFWGIRTLLWELHFVQDLHQPFHTIQAPSLKMLSWKNLFSQFIAKSTHAMANYHYAYEGMVSELVSDSTSTQIASCFETSERKLVQNPAELLNLPRSQAKRVGSALYQVFGSDLQSLDVNLPERIGEIDYFAILHEIEKSFTDEERKELSSEELLQFERQKERREGVQKLMNETCPLLKSLSSYTLGEVAEALKNVQDVSVIKTGK